MNLHQLAPSLALCLWVAACQPREVTLQGLWKLDRVEIWQRERLRKTIPSNQQYWDIGPKDTIRIYDTRRLQTTLPVRIEGELLQTGLHESTRQDTLKILAWNHNHVELASEKRAKATVSFIIWIR